MTRSRSDLMHFLVPCFLAALLPCLACATTVYKTVDKDGVVTFSDAAPVDGQTAQRLTIDVIEPQLTETEQQRLDAMRETTDRMAADRMAREQHRAELRELRARQQTVESGYSPEQSNVQPATTIISTGGYRRYRDPSFGVRYRNDHLDLYWGSRPAHPIRPIIRPPLRPGHGSHPHQHSHVNPPLQRPVYNEHPASLVRKGYDPRVRTVIETGYYPRRP